MVSVVKVYISKPSWLPFVWAGFIGTDLPIIRNIFQSQTATSLEVAFTFFPAKVQIELLCTRLVAQLSIPGSIKSGRDQERIMLTLM